jgi:hypothetical protein
VSVFYLCTELNGVNAFSLRAHRPQPRRGDVIIVDPRADRRVMEPALQKIGVLGKRQHLDDLPQRALGVPPTHGGIGFVLVITQPLEGRFEIDVWRLA